MKICFYNLTAGLRSGGLETYCWEVGRALVERGHEVSIVAGEGGEARRPEIRFVTFPYTHRNTFPNFGTRFRKLMERLSLAHHAVDHLVAENYDAIIIVKPFDIPALWQAKRRGSKATTVFRSGGTDFFAGDRWFLAAVDCWASNSYFNAVQVEARYGREVTVIYNGVDTDLFKPLPRNPAWRLAHDIPESAPLVAATGRLVGLKGFQVAIGALSQLPDVHLAIAGDGPERGRLEALARDLGMADRVHLLGPVRHGELPLMLNQADLFVLPTIGEETFGISVAEAMACGLPVLVSDTGGLPEVVEEGECGRLLPPGNTRAWHDAVADLLARPDEARAMGAKGRERSENLFTWRANAERLEQLILDKRTT